MAMTFQEIESFVDKFTVLPNQRLTVRPEFNEPDKPPRAVCIKLRSRSQIDEHVFQCDRLVSMREIESYRFPLDCIYLKIAGLARSVAEAEFDYRNPKDEMTGKQQSQNPGASH